MKPNRSFLRPVAAGARRVAIAASALLGEPVAAAAGVVAGAASMGLGGCPPDYATALAVQTQQTVRHLRVRLGAAAALPGE